MKQRQEQIKEWAEKGAEWCAKRLWDERNKLNDTTAKLRCIELKASRLECENANGYQTVLRQNHTMAGVLENHGIMPTRLRLTYRAHDEHMCEGCDGYGRDCEECAYLQECIETETFYSYRIGQEWWMGERDWVIEGATGEFEYRTTWNLIEVRDDRTNEVIWKRPEQES